MKYIRKKIKLDDRVNGKLLGMWHEIKDIVESIELDALKTAQGNVSAGVRTRHGLRTLASTARKFIVTSIEFARDKKQNNESNRKDGEAYASLESSEDRYDYEWSFDK